MIIYTRATQQQAPPGTYILTGAVVNQNTVSIKQVQCFHCTSSYTGYYLSFINTSIPDDFILEIENRNTPLLRILHNLSSINAHEKHGYNLTCVIAHSTTFFPNKPKDPHSSALSQTNLLGIIFLSSCSGLVCILCTIWVSVSYYRRFTQKRKDKKTRLALEKSTQQILDKSPIIIFNSENKDYGDTDESPMCVICLESFKTEEKIRKLACSHCYHISCIDPWLLSHQSCPLCNRNILRNSIPSISATVLSEISVRNRIEITTTTTTGTSNDNSQRIQLETSNL